MREAKRLFNRSPRVIDSTSSFFKSKQDRQLPDDSRKSSLGPGQYNVALPMVRPKFQAIRKNNNTIIVKINEKLSPVFQNHQSRFPDVKPQACPGEETFILMASQDQLQNRTNNTQKRHSLAIRSRIDKLNTILKEERRGRGQKRRKVANSVRIDRSIGSDEVVNSLKLYKKEKERLHFLLRNVKPGRNGRGVEWSKYRQTKGNLYTINNVPGPGSYEQPSVATCRYSQTIDDKSWQFKSATKRQSIADDPSQKVYQLMPSRSRFMSEVDDRFTKVQSISLIPSKLDLSSDVQHD